ncbi:terminase small subunit [Pedobacter nyackensis]|uniref:Terminase small subunit n=1 Tax=Pedobacter nyackensis TaxID=475255 RepID=A0A1W1ZW46_9SPHI|nr:terminase small subunit [Pedobacter nyackensis]SMC52679.1 Terminase small subunit [Pedobacter nyackensis]
MARLTDKQKRFCEEYLKDFNGTRSAIAAGYSENTAAVISAENLTKPNIKEYLNERLDALSMEAGEVTKRITNLARGNMSDYMSTRQVPYTPEIKVGLNVLISRLRTEIEFEDNYALQINMGEDELEKHMADQEGRRRKIIRYKLELELNPYSTRIIDGETVMIDEVYLDLAKIVQDKERGIIKSFKNTKDGIQVELYAADAALGQMAKIRGLMIDKSEVDNKVTMVKPVIIDWGDSE